MTIQVWDYRREYEAEREEILAGLDADPGGEQGAEPAVRVGAPAQDARDAVAARLGVGDECRRFGLGRFLLSPVSFPAGSNSTVINLIPIDDGEREGNETIIVRPPATLRNGARVAVAAE